MAVQVIRVQSPLRVWWIQNVPGRPTYYPVSSVEKAKAKLEALTQRDLANPSITSNAGGLEELVDGEWGEYYDEHGRSIDDDWWEVKAK